MPRAKLQRETHITLMAREPYVRMWSNDPAFHRRMKKLNIAPQEGVFHLPKAWLRISPPRKLRLTEDQREHRRAILVQNTRSHIGKRDKRIAA